MIEHLEKHLGLLAGGWRSDADGKPMPFQVGHFDSTPFRGASAFATIGLSDYPLTMETKKKSIRMELFAIVRAPEQRLGVPSILQSIGLELLGTKTALECGQVIGPRGPLWENTQLEALYACSPVYLPDEFSVCDLGDGKECVVVWLVPITPSEAAYVRSHGSGAFQSLLIDRDPDLLDPARDEVGGLCPP